MGDEGMEVENGGDGREEAGVKVAHDILAAQHTVLELLVNLTGLGDEEEGGDCGWEDEEDLEDDFDEEVEEGQEKRVDAADLAEETRLSLSKRRGGKDLL